MTLSHQQIRPKGKCSTSAAAVKRLAQMDKTVRDLLVQEAITSQGRWTRPPCPHLPMGLSSPVPVAVLCSKCLTEGQSAARAVHVWLPASTGPSRRVPSRREVPNEG